MIIRAYGLLDTKSGLFSLPWFLANDVSALRAVRDSFSDSSTTVGKYPGDFVLYHLGEFDDTIGSLLSCAPRNLGVVSAILSEGAK